ncbi:single-stranded DNA-binding protein [Xanthomonas phaseoli pv. phaseoli]|uniref:single-stranded DNA-binding protein n=1 Tax=Xanthomonas phaseoli TaxID=1985254 RepID=UPI0005386398|nr:single-stranded DNA-binding protein [Xanthomonas phaseoli]KGT50283.1 single-stranded DNA-binding protein [Xanthomonas phaseoli pv. phaseoli]KHS32420.1 single-stranded DNA-binding protein [Xanthomonas phaseoli pv. phaseoli]MBO9737347.1 single-stranded DNA-binding protein [Xanthomonas phaseoli pv. phaseoli]UZB14188.1 G5P family DNA-binding protein [Xanthomonas phaseoli pv. phaseoli]UZB23020.1 G5P family DNA-binding protein [Xanthomonas phaseoli pv. phaseoli]
MSDIKVTVLNAEVDERGGTFKDDKGEDRSYNTRKQRAKLEVGGFSYPFDVRLEDGQKPYPLGVYTLDMEKMLQVNKGVVSISKYTSLKSTAPARAAA